MTIALTKANIAELVWRGRKAALAAAGWFEARQPGPAWSTAPLFTGGASLIAAVTGLFWDVAYHIDRGRDLANLFTAPHVLILLGLLGLGATAVLSILLATVAEVETAIRVGPFRLPAAALALLVMATGAVLGFPLDDLWHRTYGIDVTMWSPTHLLMIGGAVFSTFALNLLAAEGRAASGVEAPRWRRAALAASVVIGLSVLGLEFDFGVPQWQAVYDPLLVAVTAGVGLCLARAALGPGGALLATLGYLGLRLALVLFVLAVGYTWPAFPLMLGCALCVEAAFLLERRLGAAAVALLAGVLVATAGMATEWAWNRFTGPFPWQPSMLDRYWMVAAAAIAGSLLGSALGRVLSGRPAGMPRAVAPAAVALLLLLLALPLPRLGGPLVADLRASPTGPQRAAHDRYGQPSYEQDMSIQVRLDRPGAVEGADWFTILAWQGGGRRLIRLVPDGPGSWRSESPVPTGGTWKAVVFLASGREMTSIPIYFPPDPTYGSPGYAADPEVQRRFQPSPAVLTSESHGGAPWVAWLAYLALAAVAAGWLGTLAVAAARLGRLAEPGRPRRPLGATRPRLV